MCRGLYVQGARAPVGKHLCGRGSRRQFWGWRRCSVLPCVSEFGVNAVGFGELVLENDDAAGRVERGALVDQLAGAGRDPQLVSGVAAVPAFGSHWGDQLRGIEAAKKSLGHVEKLGGASHAVCREILVVEVVLWAGLVRCTGNARSAFRVTDGGPGTCAVPGPDGALLAEARY